MKTPISYYGGKQMMAKTIVPLINACEDATTYTEPFFGGGAIFFAKEPHTVEIINDLNGEVVNFYKTVQTNFTQLNKQIKYTLHSREQHRHAQVIYNNPDLFNQVQPAWALWSLSNQSYSSNITGGWGYGKQDNTQEKKLDNKRKDFTSEYKKRLERVQIECTDAIKVIKSRDHKYAFHYCDPPYINSDCGHYEGYTQEDFNRLLNTLQKVSGRFLLSSYPNTELSKASIENGWQTIKIEKKVAVTHLTNKTKIEVLTANYDIRSIYKTLPK